MSWSNKLIADLTLDQAKLLYQYWQPSQQGQYLSFDCNGPGWIDLIWIGFQDYSGIPTHCRIRGERCCEMVLTKRQVDLFCKGLRSEINRVFDKPEQSPFRKI